jgi:KDO2-lipid IV(A) lauroyltransferase
MHWFFGSRPQRLQAFHYWVRDTCIGVLNLGINSGLRLLPIDWCSKLGSHLGLFARLRYPRSDERARKAWMKLRTDSNDQASTDKAIDSLWRCVGRTMGEYSVLDRLWQAGRITVEGVEHLDVARASDKPRLILGLHLGNWETIPPTLIAVGHPGSGIYLPPENRFDHHIAVKVRERYGAKLVPPGPLATAEALRALKENKGIFIIYCDEFIRGAVQAPALGRPHRYTGSNIAYVARLAAMTGAAVIPAYCVRVGDAARFIVRFLPAVELQSTINRKDDVRVNVERLDAVIDPLIRAHLDQWFYVLDLELDA